MINKVGDMKTLPIAECYILSRYSSDPIPTTVIKETVSTVTVKTAFGKKTFQKRKIYGGGYENPRELYETGFGGIRNKIPERETNYTNKDYLTFDVERVRREYEEKTKQEDLNQRATRLRDLINDFFPKHSSYPFNATPENITKLEALEKLFGIK